MNLANSTWAPVESIQPDAALGVDSTKQLHSQDEVSGGQWKITGWSLFGNHPTASIPGVQIKVTPAETTQGSKVRNFLVMKVIKFKYWNKVTEFKHLFPQP